MLSLTDLHKVQKVAFVKSYKADTIAFISLRGFGDAMNKMIIVICHYFFHYCLVQSVGHYPKLNS